MHLTREQKLKLVREHLDDHVLLKDLYKKYSISPHDVKYFIALYKRHGEKVFKVDSKTKRIYTREEKLKAIKRHMEENISYYELSLQLGMSEPSIVRDWVNLYKAKGEAAIQTTMSRKNYMLKDEREKFKATKKIIKRNKYLEAENEVLKKWYTLILQRSVSSKKK